jgi:hypothetical protein
MLNLLDTTGDSGFEISFVEQKKRSKELTIFDPIHPQLLAYFKERNDIQDVQKKELTQKKLSKRGRGHRGVNGNGKSKPDQNHDPQIISVARKAPVKRRKHAGNPLTAVTEKRASLRSYDTMSLCTHDEQAEDEISMSIEIESLVNAAEQVVAGTDPDPEPAAQAAEIQVQQQQLQQHFQVEEDEQVENEEVGDEEVEEVDEEEDESQGKVYCICRKGAIEGETMIQCDNAICQEWYHYRCVGLLETFRAPKNKKWFCPSCRLNDKKTGTPKSKDALVKDYILKKKMKL